MPTIQINKKDLINVDLREIGLPVVGGYYKNYNIARFGSVCVDGRTASSIIKIGRPAVYGADIAGILAFFEYMGAYYPALLQELYKQDFIKDLVNYLQEFYKDAQIQFYLHTDTHALHDNGIGCGHYKVNVNKVNIKLDKINKSVSELLKEIYDLLLDKADEITADKPDSKNTIIKEILQGDHAESMVVILDFDDKTLIRQIFMKNAFVYNPKYAKELVDFQAHLIWNYFNEKGIVDKIESLNEWQNNIFNMYQKQVNRTNAVLVEPKQLPINEVEIIE